MCLKFLFDIIQKNHKNELLFVVLVKAISMATKKSCVLFFLLQNELSITFVQFLKRGTKQFNG